ncbi:helix-turn-helix domain-containing protein [Marinicella gelatinilytica]|uniref:helix-turn-helix domain-containing protein n=1 Tax=Marinicella gelatinilytica TaxID=2996017 RepID=UPI002260AECB|nr:helix-turn-helix domain-containing protein [Marinicella gelatinilytica]MCX7546297.1 helix-turn-helix domain-containing protein [Marinicella gelatinilytica]
MDNKLFNELLESTKQMGEILHNKRQPVRVFEFPDVEIKKLREEVGLSQAEFALLIGVSKRTLENWEQGRRKPTGPAKALLRILEADPKHAIEALHS